MIGAVLRLLAVLVAGLTALPGPGRAHEVRPGLLQLVETAPDRFDMLWRVPARGDLTLSMAPRLPDTCETLGLPERQQDGARSEERRGIACAEGLSGAEIAITGLERIQTDVLVSVLYLGGGVETLRASPQDPSVRLQGRRSLPQVAATYLSLGVEHILLGIDHLLFVTALMLLVTGWRRLLGTVTAFTVAHSITLGAASFGVLSAPPALVEALIALSIVVIAAEIALARRGDTGFAIERPWIIAFGFGLLHGFGFAGALRDIGLPPDAVPTALLFFNIGVELGQIGFIGVVLLAIRGSRLMAPAVTGALRRAMPAVIGGIAGFWAIERTLAIFV